ncbi:MAG: LLM class flavin-dependent oxidoreductase [Acidimicrobiales bacterium]|nr:LLM class flavin-dependent oxidoreductase [Acidimicrobiales bacterium]
MGSPAALVELAVAAEAADWDGVALWDHLHFHRTADVDVFDPWVVLGAVAQATKRVRLGTLVTPLARRRPWKVAKELVTLDHLSAGRAVFGAGLGSPADDEFGAFGDPTGDRERADRLDEGLELVDLLVRGEPVEHRGAHFRVDAHLRPASVQRPRPPFWIAGMFPNRRPLRRAARWDGVAPVATDGNPLPPRAIAAVRALVDAERSAQGRSGPFDVVATRAEGATDADYAEAGATWVVDSIWPVGDWLSELRDTITAGPT